MIAKHKLTVFQSLAIYSASKHTLNDEHHLELLNAKILGKQCKLNNAKTC